MQCYYLLENDNEDNAVIALRIIFDLHKNYRNTLESEVKPFLTFVQCVYENLKHAVATVFSQAPDSAMPAASALPLDAGPGGEYPTASPLHQHSTF